jgi:hypothetical protein
VPLLAEVSAAIEDIREDIAEAPDTPKVIIAEGLGPSTRAAALTEPAEYIVDVDTLLETAPAISSLGEVAKIVVLLTLLGIAQNLVGLIDLFESLGGLTVIGI